MKKNDFVSYKRIDMKTKISKKKANQMKKWKRRRTWEKREREREKAKMIKGQPQKG